MDGPNPCPNRERWQASSIRRLTASSAESLSATVADANNALLSAGAVVLAAETAATVAYTWAIGNP